MRAYTLFAHHAVIAFALLAVAQVTQATEECKPEKIVDGDTFNYYGESGKIKVRIQGYDAPERAQALGPVATKKLKELVKNGAVCDCYKVDKYLRSVCRISVDGVDISTAMIAAGLGCIDPRFEGESTPALQATNRAALESAQAARRGVWSDEVPECGKQYRDKQKQ